MLTPKEIEFIVENAKADTTKLLFGAKKFAGINLKLCINCIESRRKLATKLPQWYSNTSLVYPFPLSAEQCSSGITAEYKKGVISNALSGNKLDNTNILSGNKHITGADLTGGMGVDSFYLAQLCKKAKTANGADGDSANAVDGGPEISFHYFERNNELCKATEYNFKKLGAENIAVHNIEIDSKNISLLPGTPFDFLFMDPARRSKTDKASKVISLQEYEPNIMELKEQLFKIAPTILVKVSPMADIRLNLALLPETSEIHIVAVDNECKELLFLLESPDKRTSNNTQVSITAVNLSSKGKKESFFKYTFEEEETASAIFASQTGQYLYEPNKAILKAGAFKLISQRYRCSKLAASTHLYTSDKLIENFPGKTYIVEKSIPFSKKAIKEIAAQYPNADLSARNFPLDTNTLKKLSGIKDGGDRHIFATTLNNGEKLVIVAIIKK